MNPNLHSVRSLSQETLGRQMQVNIVCNKHLESVLSKEALTEMFYL